MSGVRKMEHLKLTCAMHNIVVYDGPPRNLTEDNSNCLECEKIRDAEIRKLRSEGWTDERFRRAGWRKFEHIESVRN